MLYKNITSLNMSIGVSPLHCQPHAMPPLNQRMDDIWILIISIIASVIGVLGNGLVILLVAQSPTLRTVPNVFITNLAASDFCFLLAHPAIYSATAIGLTKWNTWLCKCIHFVRWFTQGNSIFTLVMLSVERCIAIAEPLRGYRGRSKKRFTRTGLLIIWSLALTLTLPITFTTYLNRYLLANSTVSCIYVEYCEHFPMNLKKQLGIAATFGKMIFFYLLPGACIAASYIFMASMLMQSAREMPGVNAAVVHNQVAGRRKLAKLVLALVVMFFVLWLPIHIFSVCNALHINQCFISRFQLVSSSLTYFYSCCNPIILFVMSKQYRKQARNLLNHCFCRHWTSTRRDSLNQTSALRMYSHIHADGGSTRLICSMKTSDNCMEMEPLRQEKTCHSSLG